MTMRSSMFIVFPLFILSSLQFAALARPHQFSIDACQSSQFPKLCRSHLRSFLSVFPSSSSETDLFGFGKHSVEQSLKHARKTSEVIKHHLSPEMSWSLSRRVLGSLHDCLDLTDSTVQYLESILAKFDGVDLARLSEEEVARVRTLLSAVLGNEQMCFNGLKEANSSSIAEPLSKPLSRASQVYRVSHELVTRAVLSPQMNDLHTHQYRFRTGSRMIFMEESLPSLARMPLNYLIENIRQGSCSSLKNCSPKRGGHASASSSSYIDDQGILINNIVTVGRTHRDDFSSISEAIESSPHDSRAEDGYYVIHVREGVYEEYVSIPGNRKHILLLGDGIGKTIITGDRNYRDGWSTYHSATFAVAGEGFIAVDITFRNTAGRSKGQAVAVRNEADLSTFFRCSFEGYQDTLLNHVGRQFFRECDIYGTIDFIFGFATAVFQNCNIYTRKPNHGEETVIAAQGRSNPEDTSGFSFQNCTIRPAPDLAEDPGFAMNYLGRPWFNHSRAIYMQSYIDKHIHPEGWLPFRGTFGLETLYFGEYDNRGPGSDTRRRVHWKGYHVLDSQQALNFTVYNLTAGSAWLTHTDIPHTAGLL